MREFGRYEFELMLLRRMQDFQPGLVADALTLLGATRADARVAHRRWRELGYSPTFPTDIRRFEIALGKADDARSIRFGQVVLEAHHWSLPVLWPDLAWEVVTDGQGTVLHEWLVRVTGQPSGPLQDVTAMAPWSCVVEDVVAAHPAARQVDLQLNSRWGVVAEQDGADYLATFVWGLLQTVEQRPPDSG